MTKPVIGFAGMTHLGLNSAVASADLGFEIVCFDQDHARIGNLLAGELPVVEPGLPEMLAHHATRIMFTSDPSALERCDVVYVAPDVPTNDLGESDLRSLDALISIVLDSTASGSVIVILSQVPPGFTRARTRAGRALYYQVETLIFGRAIERARHPERFIVGCADPSQHLPKPLATFLGSFECPILPMRYESAELAKISINLCLVASLGVANTMAEVCEQVGADWSEIVPALKLDKRIGQHSYLKPGLGIAGGNLERDLTTVITLADRHHTDAGIISAWIANSRHRKDWTWRTLSTLVLEKNSSARVGVLGLAYKEDTHSTKNSPSLTLLSHLSKESVRVYDPVVSPASAGVDFPAAPSALDAVDGADAVCIMTPWSEFKSLEPAALARRMRGRWLLDPFRVLDSGASRAAGLNHVTLGVASAQ